MIGSWGSDLDSAFFHQTVWNTAISQNNYITSDGFSLRSDITFAFLFSPNNNSFLSNSFLIKVK